MKIAILGYGVEGHSAYDYWSNPYNQITVCDKNEKTIVPQAAIAKLGPDYLNGLDAYDLIVRSPGLHPEEIVAANSQEILDKVTTSTNEFFKVCPTKNIIGVTGTKGKGTTSTLITRLLEESGHRVLLGGNIGKTAIDLLKDQIQPEDWVVLELSSFQLIDLKYSPHIAVCLMLAPEHLNWHADFDEYATAKSNIFAHQINTDIAIYYSENSSSRDLANVSSGKKIPYYADPGAYVKDDHIIINDQVVCNTVDLKLIGKHNWQNICAAITASWQIDQDLQNVQRVVINFRGLEHRLELVREVGEVKYFNDSFASVPDAAIAAIEALPGPKVLIIGGYDRGLDLSKLSISIKDHQSEIEKVVLIGASAQRVADEFRKVGFDNFQISLAGSMAEIVEIAKGLAKPKETVILSPGFPSFDMFENFEDRGTQFKNEVNKI